MRKDGSLSQKSENSLINVVLKPRQLRTWFSIRGTGIYLLTTEFCARIIWYFHFPMCKNTFQIARLYSDFQAFHISNSFSFIKFVTRSPVPHNPNISPCPLSLMTFITSFSVPMLHDFCDSFQASPLSPECSYKIP